MHFFASFYRVKRIFSESFSDSVFMPFDALKAGQKSAGFLQHEKAGKAEGFFEQAGHPDAVV